MPDYKYAKYRTIVLESQTKPLNGENERSSHNYDFYTLKKGRLLWILPPGVTIDMKNDVNNWPDSTVFSGIENGRETSYPDKQNLYVANPRGTQGLPGPFEIVVRVID